MLFCWEKMMLFFREDEWKKSSKISDIDGVTSASEFRTISSVTVTEARCDEARNVTQSRIGVFAFLIS